MKWLDPTWLDPAEALGKPLLPFPPPMHWMDMQTRASLLDFDEGIHSWLLYRCWALVRCSGRWPMQLFGAKRMPVCMASCPL